jgi:nucleoside-diphosphate-sugar epimerase
VTSVRILVAGNQTKLGETVARRLAAFHDVRVLGATPGGPIGSVRRIEGDARDRDVAVAATAGCDAVIQVANSAAIGATPLDALDIATRGTYYLMTTGKSLSRFIVLSSLRMFERYPANYWITEQWAPRPTTDPDDLVPFLAEATVREASRVLPLAAIALRIGVIVLD